MWILYVNKTEFIVLRTRQQRKKIDIPNTNINESEISPISIVHNMWVMFSNDKNMWADDNQ